MKNRAVLLFLWLALSTFAVRADDPPAGGKAPAEEAKKEPFRNVGVDEFAKLRGGSTNNVVLDVRTPKEFERGHIPGAINIDVNSPDFKEKTKTLDKSKLYLVNCAAGVRSAKACKILYGLDFPNLVNLEGGFKSWEKAGKPVEK
jgi:rhodanese-related sulfurtransferase